MTGQSTHLVLPPVTAEVAATALEPLPARLRKRVDGAVAKAAAWPIDATENGDGVVVRAVVRVDDETSVTLVAPDGTVTTADDVTCTCLLAPACLHRAAVLLRAPLPEEALSREGEEKAEGTELSADSSDTPPPTAPAPAPAPTRTPDPHHPPLTPPQATTTRALWTAATDVLVAGVGGAGAGAGGGAVHRARLLHAAHSARLAGLHRPSAAAVRVARMLGEAAAEDPGFRLADLTQEITELLHVLYGLRSRQIADPDLIGTARRAYRSERPLRLHGLFTEPVVTASGYAGAVTYALAPDGRLRTVSDVAPGGPDRVRRAAGSSVPGGCALSLREFGDGGGVSLTAPTVSPDGRIGAGKTVRSVRASGAAWSQDPLDDLWQRPPHTQLTDCLAWLATPVEERTSVGGDLVFLRGTVTARGLAVLGGPTLRLLAPDERPELPYAENLRLIAARPGLSLRVVARVAPGRPGGVLALAAAWTGHDDRTFRADLGLRRLNTTQLPPHTKPTAPPTDEPSPSFSASFSPSSPPPSPSLPMELGLLRRAVDRAVAGGRPVAAADTGGELPRRLQAVGLTTGALCARRLTDTAADRTHDALGRLRPADPDAYAQAWLAASLYARAATASLLTAAWTPRIPEVSPT
ncbi:hypothetical protein ABZ921_03875 [Streptomyces atriruber]|uniref:SWIM-type domain-containing protein n=1 Tax=Streptomyces atriruber TaxID=545121 RepID=A0ABV3BFH1_9ACTN